MKQNRKTALRIFGLTALGLILAASVPLRAQNGIAHIQDVSVRQTSSGNEIVIIADRPMDFNSFTLDNPTRLCLNIRSSRLNNTRGDSKAIYNGNLLRVRTGQYNSDTARVVMDMARLTPHRIVRNDNIIVVQLDEQKEKKSAKVSEVKLEDTLDGVNVVISGNEPLQYTESTLTDPNRIVINITGALNQVASSMMTVNKSGIENIEISQFQTDPEKIVRVVIKLVSQIEHTASANGNAVVVNIKSATQTASKELETTPGLDEIPLPDAALPGAELITPDGDIPDLALDLPGGDLSDLSAPGDLPDLDAGMQTASAKETPEATPQIDQALLPELPEAPADVSGQVAQTELPELPGAPDKAASQIDQAQLPELPEAPAEAPQQMAQAQLPELPEAPAEAPQQTEQAQLPELPEAPAEAPQQMAQAQLPELPEAPAEAPQQMAQAQLPELPEAPAEAPQQTEQAQLPELPEAPAEAPQQTEQAQLPELPSVEIPTTQPAESQENIQAPGLEPEMSAVQQPSGAIDEEKEAMQHEIAQIQARLLESQSQSDGLRKRLDKQQAKVRALSNQQSEVKRMRAEIKARLNDAIRKQAQAAGRLRRITRARVSFNYENTKIRTFLKFIAMKSGVNIIAGPEVRGDIVASLDKVPWQKALKVVLNTYGYDWVYTDKNRQIIWVSRKETIQKEKESRVRVKEIEAPETIFVTLNYATAGQVQNSIAKLLTPNRGRVQVDSRTNTLIITDQRENMDNIRKALELLDRRTRQVMIEAKIVEVTLTSNHETGVNWSAITNISGFGHVNFDTNMSPSGQSASIAVGTVPGDFSGILSWLETWGKTNVLSNPRIATLDNQEARILIGDMVAYPSSIDVYGRQTYKTVDVGITMRVTPHINMDDYITMKIHPEVSTLNGNTPDGVPIINTREADTTVIVKDGDTIVLAGLIRDEETQSLQKVPILGDILPALFKKKNKTKRKTELVVFITPTILK